MDGGSLLARFGVTAHIKSCGQQQAHDETTQASCRWHISSGRSGQRPGAHRERRRKKRHRERYHQ